MCLFGHAWRRYSGRGRDVDSLVCNADPVCDGHFCANDGEQHHADRGSNFSTDIGAHEGTDLGTNLCADNGAESEPCADDRSNAYARGHAGVYTNGGRNFRRERNDWNFDIALGPRRYGCGLHAGSPRPSGRYGEHTDLRRRFGI
jgi:hypothetical protein